jgi:endoglycosylceramidase
MYDPSAELSGEFDAARRDALLATAEDLAADARGLGLPLWIGVYGGVGESPQIGAYMDAAYDGTAAAFAGSTYWAMDRGPGYALLDADGDEKPALFDAVARPYPARVAGEPLAWTYDDATRTLEVSWRPDATITAPTVIVTPAWTYPTGVTVDCDGCTVVTRDGEVEVTGGASVTVRPGS